VLAVVLSALPLAASARTLLVLGDSLSAAFGINTDKGWVELLRTRLADEPQPWELVNASLSGETTAGGLTRLPALLQQHAPELVIIELGSNDGLRGLGFGQMRGNLARMIELVKDAGGEAVLVGGMLPPNYGAAYADAFHDQFRQIAASHEVSLVPFLLVGVAQDRKLMQADGYHPTAEAQPRLLENVWPVLAPLLRP
jgi:acyl-CoA thioesterase-1